MIYCPGCRSVISNAAFNCPRCGHPIGRARATRVLKIVVIAWLSVAALAVIAGVCLWMHALHMRDEWMERTERSSGTDQIPIRLHIVPVVPDQ